MAAHPTRGVTAAIAAVAASLAASLAAVAASATPAQPAYDSTALEALLDPADPGHLLGLQVAVLVDGVLWEWARGRRFVHPAERARDLPLTTTSLVRAASASKPVAAIAALRLVESGRLALDTDVSATLGYPLRNPRHPDAPITLRMLLSHTSSIVDGGGYVLPLGAALRPLFTPGSAEWDGGSRFSAHRPGARFEYSNLGWGVIGALIERASGERFDRFVAREVLAPAGVPGGFDVATLDPARLATLYRRGAEEATAWPADGPWLAQMDDPRPPAEGGSGRWVAPGADPRLASYALGENGALFSPQGGLRTTAGGLARLLQALLVGDRLLKPATRAAMLAPQWRFDPLAANGDSWRGAYLEWGLGLQRFTGAHDPARGLLDSPSARLDGRPLVGHLAEAYGMFGGAWFTPDGRRGVVYLATGTAQPLDANPGARSALRRWEEVIVDWAAREAWGLP